MARCPGPLPVLELGSRPVQSRKVTASHPGRAGELFPPARGSSPEPRQGAAGEAGDDRVRSERAERPRSRALAAAALAAGLVLAGPALASGDSIVLQPELPKLLALIALFVLLVFPVNTLLFKPIFTALDARDEKIAGTRARAAKLAADADELLRHYEGQLQANTGLERPQASAPLRMGISGVDQHHRIEDVHNRDCRELHDGS